MSVHLQRQVFKIFRVAEYFTVRELQTQGGIRSGHYNGPL